MPKWSIAIQGFYKPEYYIRKVGTFEQIVQEPVIIRGKPRLVNRKVVQRNPAVAFLLSDEFVEYDDEIRSGDLRFPKPEYYLYQCTGVIRRAIPGDIIAYKPFGQEWSDVERKEFLIAEIDGPDESQMSALCEMEMDLTSYEKYDPMKYEDWVLLMSDKNARKADPIKANSLLAVNSDKWYAEYLQGTQEQCQFPKAHWRKRRFNIGLDKLENLGVDTTIMLNKGIEYQPVIRTLEPMDFFDKLKKRDVETTDGLNHIQPLTLAEMRAPKDAETKLAEVRDGLL